MKQGDSVKLVARNEGIEYKDQFNVYRFGVKLMNKRWVVCVPGSKGER